MRVLVAGIGNVFFGDDGFGPAVASRLAQVAQPDGVDVRDYGIRGIHLAYDLLDRAHQALVLVDAVPLDDAPGSLAVIEVDDPDAFGEQLDAHSMNPATVLSALSTLGATPGRVMVVGCQPEQLDQGMCLSPAVAAAVDDAVRLVPGLIEEMTASVTVAGDREVQECTRWGSARPSPRRSSDAPGDAV